MIIWSSITVLFCSYYSEIQPVESSTVSILTCGEGWHNFHHTFPSDYRASEYGHKHDLSSRVIQLMEKRGWAYNLKETPQHLVNKWVKKFGDGSHMLSCEWKEDSSDDAETQLSTNKVLNCREEIIRSDMRAYNNVVKATNENIAARRLNTSNAWITQTRLWKNSGVSTTKHVGMSALLTLVPCLPWKSNTVWCYMN